MNLNFKRGSRVRHRHGKHETGVIDRMKWLGRVVVFVRLDEIYGGSVLAFRIGQLELIKEA